MILIHELREYSWIGGHEADIDADFMRFYRLYDIEGLTSQRFIALAERLFAYGGVMTRRFIEENLESTKIKYVDDFSSSDSDPKAQARRLKSMGARVRTAQAEKKSYLYELLEAEL